MEAYKLITSKGLTRQDLVDGNRRISSVEKPVSSIESDLVEELKREMNIVIKLSKQPVKKPVVVGYDNTIALLPGQYDRFPTVSMGHFFLADTLSNESCVRKAKSLVDLGCGCGFSGNYAAKNFEGLKNGRVIFGDLFPESINAALNAYLLNNGLSRDNVDISKTEHGLLMVNDQNDQLVEFKEGDVKSTMRRCTEKFIGPDNRTHKYDPSQVDVAVASPIYIPEICEVFPQAFALFGEVSKNLGADFYVTHSSLADKVVEEAAKQTGAHLTDINSRKFALDLSTTDSRKNRSLNEEIVEKLRPLGLITEINGANVQYGHQLRVSKMSYK